ncbi:PaaI family thioesterase [Blattabacterium cuenoti]|uniref:PaaI family thioesterase n=1 Tax=Blattabacterium cuenoti TaxID=1653831 RepID=UPI00163CF2E1|nr:hotdog fold thioesterase [Blattabacterium cuenoti]
MKKEIKELLNELNNLKKNTLISEMRIQFIFLSTKLDFLIAKMPINNKILQPFGYLHGGATITLAESVGSSLSFINLKVKKLKEDKSAVSVEKNNFNVKNIEISANHILCIKKGILFAKAKIFHKGKTLHVIQIDVYNEKKDVISFCKMTNFIIKTR